MGGTAGHLWFLSALLQALTLLAIFISLKKDKLLVYISMLLYLLTPVANLYFQLGIVEEYTWNPAVGPFISTIFVTGGWWLSRKKEFRMGWGIALLIVGFFLSWGQGKFAEYFYHIHPTFYAYGNLFMALGIFIAVLSYPRFCENTILPQLGQLTLGVYCSHILFVDAFKNFREEINPFVWDFVVPVLIYLLALGLTIFLRRIPFLKERIV
jgi:surface polysaccharide O-acyltransferase-like enzyme